MVSGEDRGHEGRDRREIRVIELAIEADRANGRRTDAREDADELALFVAHRVRLPPGDEENAHVLIRGAQRVDEHRLVPESLEQPLGAFGRGRARGD